MTKEHDSQSAQRGNKTSSPGPESESSAVRTTSTLTSKAPAEGGISIVEGGADRTDLDSSFRQVTRSPGRSISSALIGVLVLESAAIVVMTLMRRRSRRPVSTAKQASALFDRAAHEALEHARELVTDSAERFASLEETLAHMARQIPEMHPVQRAMRRAS